MSTDPTPQTDIAGLVEELRGGCVFHDYGEVDIMATEPLLERAATALSTQAEEIARLTRERDEARAVVIDCNNSLFGSQGYFVSEQAAAIEGLKGAKNRQWQRAEAAEALAETLKGAIQNLLDQKITARSEARALLHSPEPGPIEPGRDGEGRDHSSSIASRGGTASPKSDGDGGH